MAHITRRCVKDGCRRRLPEGARTCPGCGGRGARWIARYVDPDHRERSQSFARKVDAERFLADQEVGKARGTWIDPELGRTAFAAWVEQWRPTTVHLSPASRSRLEGILRTHLLPRFGGRELAAIRTTDVRALVADLTASDAAPGTVRKVYNVLRSVLGAAEESGLLGRSPCIGIDLPAEGPPPERYLDAEDVERLAATIDPRYRALVLLAAYCGPRFGELAGLEVGKLDLLRRRITIGRAIVESGGRLHAGPTKTRQRRSFTMPRVVSDAIAEHLGRDPDPSALVFTDPAGGPIRRTNFRRRFFDPATEAAKLSPLRFHDLRHTAASLMAANGYQLHEVATVLGHSTIVTTRRYAHLFETRDEELAERLDRTARKARKAARSVAATGRRRDDDGTTVVPLRRRRAN